MTNFTVKDWRDLKQHLVQKFKYDLFDEKTLSHIKAAVDSYLESRYKFPLFINGNEVTEVIIFPDDVNRSVDILFGCAE